MRALVGLQVMSLRGAQIRDRDFAQVTLDGHGRTAHWDAMGPPTATRGPCCPATLAGAAGAIVTSELAVCTWSCQAVGSACRLSPDNAGASARTMLAPPVQVLATTWAKSWAKALMSSANGRVAAPKEAAAVSVAVAAFASVASGAPALLLASALRVPLELEASVAT